MRTAILIIGIALALASCAAPNQIMIHPQSKQVVDCSTWGWGWAGTPMALINCERCIERYRQLGFIKIEEAQERGIVPATNQQKPGCVNCAPTLIQSNTTNNK